MSPVLKSRYLDFRAAAFGLDSESFMNLDFDIDSVFSFLESMPEMELKALADERAVDLFRLTAANVPAYSSFLAANSISADNIDSFDDFLKHVPSVSKSDYLLRYPLEELVWGGDLTAATFASASSGSSGNSFFWPRDRASEIEVSINYELLLQENFDIATKSTLIISCFALGIYTGGTYTLNALDMIASRDYPITITTPGIVLADVISVYQELHDKYEQVVFFGYPPFIKDVLELGKRVHNIDWTSNSVGFLFSSENYSLAFEDYIHSLASTSDARAAIVHMYASSDAGIIGYGDAYANRLRGLEGDAAAALFNSTSTPSIHVFNNLSKYLEVQDNNLLISTAGFLPLVRYNIQDTGGLLDARQVHAFFSADLASLDSDQRALPYVYLTGRSDIVATAYGVNIYPDHVKAVFESVSMRDLFSGKFAIETVNDAQLNQHLSIVMELKRAVQESEVQYGIVLKEVIAALVAHSHEFKALLNGIAEDDIVKLKFVKKGAAPFDRHGIKAKYVL